MKSITRSLLRSGVLAVLIAAISFPLQARAEGTVSGTITDARDGSPVAGVTLRFGVNGLIFGFMPRDDVPVAVTDADGKFQITGIPVRSGYLLRIEPPEPYLWQSWPDSPCLSTWCDLNHFDSITVVDGEDFTANASITTPGIVAGSIRRESDHQPVSGATVRVRSRDWQASTTSGIDGRYAATGLPPGSYEVLVHAPGQNLVAEIFPDTFCQPALFCRAPAEGGEVNVVADQTRDSIDFDLMEGATIGGSVHEIGIDTVLLGAGIRLTRLEGTSVTTYGKRFLPEDEGEFAFTGLPPGTYVISTENDGGSARYANEIYDDLACQRDECELDEIITGNAIVLERGQVAAIDIELARAASISGCVTDATTGEGLAGVEVIAYRASSDSSLDINSVTSGEDGCYVVDALPESDQIPMRLRTFNSAGYVDQLHAGIPCLGGACRLELGSAIEFPSNSDLAGFDFSLHPGASISGRVRGTMGGPAIEGATVELNAVAGLTGWPDKLLTTGVDGRFQSNGLMDNTYFLEVWIGSGRFAGRHVYGAPATPENPVPAFSSGTPILIESGVGVGGIDIVLDPTGVFLDGFE